MAMMFAAIVTATLLGILGYFLFGDSGRHGRREDESRLHLSPQWFIDVPSART
jgi:hypothetical protein